MATIKITPEELRAAADFLEQKLEAINGEVSALKGKLMKFHQIGKARHRVHLLKRLKVICIRF